MIEFQAWVNQELDKIILSARLLGVHVAYMPSYEGRRMGLLDRKEHEFTNAQVQVTHGPLMGSLWICCDRDVFEKRIRIPGVNAEYRNYDYNGQERTPMLDPNGSSGFWSYGPHRYEIHHGTDRDVIK